MFFGGKRIDEILQVVIPHIQRLPHILLSFITAEIVSKVVGLPVQDVIFPLVFEEEIDKSVEQSFPGWDVHFTIDLNALARIKVFQLSQIEAGKIIIELHLVQLFSSLELP